MLAPPAYGFLEIGGTLISREAPHFRLERSNATMEWIHGNFQHRLYYLQNLVLVLDRHLRHRDDIGRRLA